VSRCATLHYTTTSLSRCGTLHYSTLLLRCHSTGVYVYAWHIMHIRIRICMAHHAYTYTYMHGISCIYVYTSIGVAREKEVVV